MSDKKPLRIALKFSDELFDQIKSDPDSVLVLTDDEFNPTYELYIQYGTPKAVFVDE